MAGWGAQRRVYVVAAGFGQVPAVASGGEEALRVQRLARLQDVRLGAVAVPGVRQPLAGGCPFRVDDDREVITVQAVAVDDDRDGTCVLELQLGDDGLKRRVAGGRAVHPQGQLQRTGTRPAGLLE